MRKSLVLGLGHIHVSMLEQRGILEAIRTCHDYPPPVPWP